MNLRNITCLSLLLALSAGCRVSSNMIMDRGVDGVMLAEAKVEDGRTTTWRIHPGAAGKPRLERTVAYKEVHPRIGVTVGPVNRKRAEGAGVEPWKGVWVEKVSSGYPANKMGVVEGDIILKVGQADITSVEQFHDVLGETSQVGAPMDFVLRIYRGRGEPIESNRTASLAITPVGVDVNQSKTDSFSLETSKGVLAFTGLQLAQITPDLCKEAFGEEQGRLVVSGVSTGSPAYEAGFRSGDQVLSCDGHSVESIKDVRQAVHQRIVQKRLDGSLHDLTGLDAPRSAGSVSGKIPLEVKGPLGHHTGELALRADLQGGSKISIPIVLQYDQRLNRKSVSFLDFIFQFGFNYRSRIQPSMTRKPVKTWDFSLFPLGMFEIEKGASRTNYRLFWFITFGSKR